MLLNIWEQAIDAGDFHEMALDETREGEKTIGRLDRGVDQLEQQESDQGDGELNADGVLADSKELADFEVLLDPTEEQLDGPATLVEIGDLLGGGIEIVGEDAQDFTGLDPVAFFSL